MRSQRATPNLSRGFTSKFAVLCGFVLSGNVKTQGDSAVYSFLLPFVVYKKCKNPPRNM